MTDEQVLMGRLRDLAKRAYEKNIYTYSSFLSLPEQSILDGMAKELSFIPYELFGGHEMAERKVVGFGSEELFGYPGRFPATMLKVTPALEKFGEELNHRDYLGSLMNLGIRRDTIGDILVKGKTGFIFCLDEVSEFIRENLVKIRHTQVSCEIIEDDIELKPTLIDESYPVSSMRLDVIIAATCNLSRKEALGFFEKNEVQLNSRVTTENAVNLKPGDVFSVRGKGKFILESIGGTTKRGRTYINVKRYQ